MSQEEQEEKQHIAYYTSTITAWFNTRMEHDKSLLTLSSAGIGVLITIAQKLDINTLLRLSLYIAALVSFIICIVAVLAIYKRNGTHLEELVGGNNANENDPLLRIFDWTAISGFVAGIVIASFLAFGIALNSLRIQEKSSMTTDNKSKSGPVLTGDSFNRVSNMRPASPVDLTKSFNGAIKLKPTAAPAAQAQAAQSQQQQPAGTTPTASSPNLEAVGPKK